MDTRSRYYSRPGGRGVELDIERAPGDGRPESRHVDEDSIRIVGQGKDLSNAAKVQLWKPFIAPSLKDLHAQNKTSQRSFGIVRPDAGSLKFFIETEDQAEATARELNKSAFQQVSLFEEPLAKMPAPDHAFGYRFTSDGYPHRHYVHDWEVQAAYLAYRRRYGDKALEMMQQEYGTNIPKHNPHFIMGTMKAHPQTFIAIGILRSGLDPAELDKQGGLF